MHVTSASQTFSITPDYIIFVASVSCNIAGRPPGATVTFSPSSFAAGSAGGKVQLTIQTAALTSSLCRHHGNLAIALLFTAP
jgi:hypothetical protein